MRTWVMGTRPNLLIVGLPSEVVSVAAQLLASKAFESGDR